MKTSDIPQITTHYADGRPSKVRDLTPEEIAEQLEALNALEN